MSAIVLLSLRCAACRLPWVQTMGTGGNRCPFCGGRAGTARRLD